MTDVQYNSCTCTRAYDFFYRLTMTTSNIVYNLTLLLKVSHDRHFRIRQKTTCLLDGSIRPCIYRVHTVPAHMWVHACVRAWMDGPPRGSSCCVGGVLVIWTSNDGFHTIVRRLLHSSANAVFWICRCIKVHVLGTEMILRDSQASATATGWTTRCTRVRTIPGPKTPTAPENEALAYGWICLFT